MEICPRPTFGQAWGGQEPANEITKSTNQESLMVKVKEEHYFHETYLSAEYTELFQLFNQDALDKYIVSCYCL